MTTALIRGAFEYQGQKCSAASRAYLPESLWYQDQGRLRSPGRRRSPWATWPKTCRCSWARSSTTRAFAKHTAALERARNTPSVEILAGGTADDSEGFFVRPTVLDSPDPADEIFTTEYFGPILAVHVYPTPRTSKR